MSGRRNPNHWTAQSRDSDDPESPDVVDSGVVWWFHPSEIDGQHSNIVFLHQEILSSRLGYSNRQSASDWTSHEIDTFTKAEPVT